MSTNPTQVAIVTGASRGIGKAVALRLADDGFCVCVGYCGNQMQAEAVVDEIESRGCKAIAVQADVADPDDVARLFSATQAALGRLDAVISNAGVMSPAPIKTDNLRAFDRMMSINVRGTFLVLAKAAEVLGEGGRIVALSTSVIAKALPGYGPYIASKSAVEGLVHVLANELRGRNITVNAIAPGPVATELFFNGKTDEQVTMAAKMAPLERLGQPVDIANAVSFLVGKDGGWINSQVIRVNGGFA
jgi:3-oxoacyl-[acyl-carrier protein] reductase